MLPPHALGADGAINITARQIGAVLGVSILVALIGSTTRGLSAYQAGWSFAAIAASTAAASALALNRSTAPGGTDSRNPVIQTRPHGCPGGGGHCGMTDHRGRH